MLKNIIQNVKQDITSIYFLGSILLVFFVCILSPGIGALNYNYINRPMIIEELFQHRKTEFMGFGEIYNCENIFLAGINGFLYIIFPLLSMASVNRYCEERISGFWLQKMVRSRRYIGTAGNVISSSLVSILTISAGLALFMLIVVIRLPSQKVVNSVFLIHWFYMCGVAVLSTLLSILTASVTKNKFYSFMIPLLLFYAENEFLIGKKGILSNFSVQVLLYPENKIAGVGFIVIGIGVLYMLLDKAERGWSGIGL